MRAPAKQVSATEVKNRFGDYLGEVVSRREPLLIERHGKPVAVLVDAGRWQRLRDQPTSERSTPWIEACKRLHERLKKGRRLKPFSAAKLIRQIRDEGY